MMNTTLDRKRILIFLALAFGIAWAGALVIYLTGGLEGSPFTYLIHSGVHGRADGRTRADPRHYP